MVPRSAVGSGVADRRPVGPRAPVEGAPIADGEFQAIRAWLRDVTGISLSSEKKALVMGRLAPRLRHHALSSYGAYFEMLRGGAHPDETQIAIDRLTTNETHFFREPKHFDFLRERIVPGHPAARMLRVWSAASSSGEEPYSIAMTLAASRPAAPWEVVASDLSTRVLERARTGHYSMTSAKTIPRSYLRDYCLKGVGRQEGTFLVEPRLRSHVQFAQINLVGVLPRIGEFDVIFLRNVLIYFDQSTKLLVLARVQSHLRSGGYLFVGHSESLAGACDALTGLQPSIYRKP